MTQQEIAMRIKERLSRISQKYDTKEEQLLYEQGILLGLIASLSEIDSNNLNLVIKKLKELESQK